jgi:hypothetical protein
VLGSRLGYELEPAVDEDLDNRDAGGINEACELRAVNRLLAIELLATAGMLLEAEVVAPD